MKVRFPDGFGIKHGHWVRGKMYMCCSCCGMPIWTIKGFESVQMAVLDMFCPHCGAKMDEVSE